MKIKLVSYNIHKGFDPLNQKFILEDIRELIRKTHADIVCLQEVVGRNEKLNDRGHIDNQIEFLADEFWSHYSYAKNAVYDHGHHGNLVLSKYPIDEFKNLDLSTNKYEQRGLLVCKLRLPDVDKKLTVMTTHLNLTHKGRAQQYGEIRNELNHHGGEPILLAGDFNDWNKRASTLLEGALGFEETHKKVKGAYAKTFPAFYPFLPLDRIYARNLNILDARVLEVPHKMKLSDHLPLYTEVEVV